MNSKGYLKAKISSTKETVKILSVKSRQNYSEIEEDTKKLQRFIDNINNALTFIDEQDAKIKEEIKENKEKLRILETFKAENDEYNRAVKGKIDEFKKEKEGNLFNLVKGIYNKLSKTVHYRLTDATNVIISVEQDNVSPKEVVKIYNQYESIFHNFLHKFS